LSIIVYSLAVDPANPDRIYIGFYGGGLAVSLDGGGTWSLSAAGMLPQAMVSAIVVDPTNPQVVYAGTLNSGVYLSLDGGETWRTVDHPRSGHPTAAFEGLFFLSRTHGWVICTVKERKTQRGAPVDVERLEILRTEDGGRTFRVARVPAVPRGHLLPYHLDFSSPQDGWAAVGGPSLLHTTNGGETWEVVTPVVGGVRNRAELMDCSFPTRADGWAVGDRGIALHTRDGGKTWERVETGTEGITNVELTRVAFADTGTGWILGEGGIYPSDMRVVYQPSHQISFILKYVP
jgi:photosystem II stability/assembly factor-like uncharacterized protein